MDAQALVDHIFNCTKPPSPLPPNSGGNASRRHPDFPESRLDKDVIDRVLGLKVAEIKDELSVLHNLSVAEVSKHFGTRKQKLQNRLLNDLESRLPPEEEDRGGDRNNAVGIVVSPVVLQSTVSACDPMAMESVERSNDDDGADNDCSMEVVPADVMLEDGPMATTTTETMLRSSRAGVENHLQSPPKVSEAAGDRSTGVMEPEDPVVPTPFAVDDAEDAESAPASSQVVHHIAHDSSSNNGHRSNNFAVDTTVASIPFDEVAATTGMDIDNNADVDMDVEVVDANKLEPVAEVDSCRKRSRSPSASSSSTSLMSFVKVPPSSAFGKENSSSSNSSTSSAVERVQSTFNNMSVQHSPLRKFAKVNDSSKGGGSIVATSAIEARRELDLPTGKSMTDPGPTWLDKRKAELAQQSLSVPPKPSRSWKPSASTATPSTAAGPSSVATLSKLYADDKFPLASSYQPPAAGAATTQPRSGGGGPTAPAANNNPRNLVEKMRNKVRPSFSPQNHASESFNSFSHFPFLIRAPEQNLSSQRPRTVRRQQRPALARFGDPSVSQRHGRRLWNERRGETEGDEQQDPSKGAGKPSRRS